MSTLNRGSAQMVARAYLARKARQRRADRMHAIACALVVLGASVPCVATLVVCWSC